MDKIFAAQVNRLPDAPELRAALKFLCLESNKLYNSTLYLARQLYFKAGKFSNGRWLSTQMKRNPHMKALYTSAAQQTCISVGEAFKGFKELLNLWRKGELPERPFAAKVPNFRWALPDKLPKEMAEADRRAGSSANGDGLQGLV